MKRVSFLAGVLVILGALFGFAPVAHADVSNFTINDFSADYTLGQDDPQGTLTVKEQLSVNFTDYNHGILRALPERYNSMPLHVSVRQVMRDGVTENYTTYKSNGNLVLKIGNANQTITGQHKYEIDYKVTNVMRFVGDGAELDWNVNGTEWQQPFLRVTARLHVPASLAGKLTDNKCYTGATGSTSSDCATTTTNGVTMFTTTRELYTGETLTFNDSVPAGYFHKPTLADRWADYGKDILLAAGIPLVVLVLSGSVWYKGGRDAKGRGTIVPEYAPPDGLKPAEIDVILHNKLGNNAISATIIDLAIRKHLSIQEGQSDGVLGLGKHKTYSFVRLPVPPSDTLSDYETQILDGLFGAITTASDNVALDEIRSQLQTNSGTTLGKIFGSKIESMLPTGPVAVGQTVKISSLKATFYTTAQAVQKSIPKSLAGRGYFKRNPSTAGGLWRVMVPFVIFGSFFVFQLSIALSIGILLSGIIMLIFAWLMPARTAKGAAAKDAIEGLKLYLNTAEKDRIAMLQSPDAPYAAQSAEPVKTVELFEKLLPYAMVLGVEKQWANQFQDIYKTPPDWYSGNWSTFNAVYLADSLSSSMSAMNSSFAAPSSSGSGGGGFSGGGGGGGGGGGW